MHRLLVVERKSDKGDGAFSNALKRFFPDAKVAIRDSLSDVTQYKMDIAWDIIFADIDLATNASGDIVVALKRSYPEAKIFVLVSKRSQYSEGVALRAGATGCITKDASIDSPVSLLLNMRIPASCLLSACRTVVDPAKSGCFASCADNIPLSQPGKELTERERQILSIVAQGASRNDAALLLEISVNTVAFHLKSIYKKLRISSRAEAGLAAQEMGLIR